MQHTVKQLIEKIDAMKNRALVLQSRIEQKQSPETYQHEIDQIQSMAYEIAHDKNGNNY